MRSPQTLTRRLVPALAIALVSSLMLGALVVTANAGDAEPALPPWFGVAEPRAGDAWRYNATLGEGWAFGDADTVRPGEPVPFASLRWAGSGQARGADGFLHTANQLVAHGLSFQPEAIAHAEQARADGHETGEVTAWPTASSFAWVLAGDHSLLHAGWAGAGNHTFTQYGLVAGIGAQVSRANAEWRHLDFDAAGSCLAWNALQGANLTLAAPVELFGPCEVGGLRLGLATGLPFTATGVEMANGVQAIRFDAADKAGSYAAWLAPGIPYPVRLQVSLLLSDGDAGDATAHAEAESDNQAHARSSSVKVTGTDAPARREATLDLVGFAPGNASLAPVDRPSDPAPALQMAARTAWGIDDTGVEHPFPLSAAYKAAKEDPTFADLRTFLAAHPDAYMAAAAYEESPSGPGQRERAWHMTLSDGRESLGLEVAQGSVDPLLPTALRGQAPPVVTVRHGWGAWPMLEGLPPSAVPAEFPTAASLLARWAAFDGSGTKGAAWSFHLACAEPGADGPCSKAQVVAGAGVDRLGMSAFYTPLGVPGNPFGTETFARVDREVEFTQDGRATRLQVYDDRVDTASVGSGPLPPSPVSADGGGFEVHSSAVAGLPATRWLPAPEEAASVGFLGLMLGALYWVWPKLKALAFLGLFSRVEKGDLLDHPARQRLVQLVEAEPGIHFHVLAQRAELANGTATHHLRKLAASGHVTVRKSGRYACYFPGSRVEARAAAAAPILKSGGARQVLATVRARPGLSNLELATATGLTPSTVNYHAQRLATAGLLEATRDGRSVRFRPLAPLRSEGGNAAA